MEQVHSIQFNKQTQGKTGFEILRLEDLMQSEKMTEKFGVSHRLTFYALLFITEGNGRHSIDFESHSYQKGSLLFISNEQVHAFLSEESYKGYLILFTEEFLMKNLSTSEIKAFGSLFSHELYNPVVTIESKTIPSFLRLTQNMEEEFLSNFDLLSEDILRNQLKAFLLKAERFRISNSKVADSKYYQEFLLFQNLLRVNVKQQTQVQFYADKLFMSTKKLNTITHELLGSPAKKVITDIRILKIKRALMHKTESIKEIAYDFGFDDPTNLVKYFKKQTGTTPSDFRELNG